jgi:hypothetical protein
LSTFRSRALVRDPRTSQFLFINLAVAMGPVLTSRGDNFVPMTNGPAHLTDEALLDAVRRLAAREHHSAADLVEHFVELDARRLYLGEGFSSLFEYCLRALNLSEDRACNHIAAARAARAFPAVVPMLRDGLLNLSTLRLLASHLTVENHASLLAEARHKSKRAVEQLLARRFPRPDVATCIRRYPAVEPLADDRYLFRLTVDGATVSLLRRAQDLGRYTLPGGDEAEIVKRALMAYVKDLEKGRFSATSRPRAVPRPRDDASRDVPAHVQRAVWARDEGQCAFVGGRGLRCEARTFLEFHHLSPYIAGGEATVENIALRCRAHNQYEADRFLAPIRAAMSVRHSTRPGAG